MDIERLRTILTDRKVCESIRRSISGCDDRYNENGFLVYLSPEGVVHCGNVHGTSREEFRKLELEAMEKADRFTDLIKRMGCRVEVLSDFAIDEAEEYVAAAEFMYKADTEKGLVALVKWDFEEPDENAEQVLAGILSKPGKKFHTSFLNSRARGPDYLQMNHLSYTMANLILIRGYSCDKASDTSPFVAVRQNKAPLDNDILVLAMTAEAYGTNVSDAEKIAQKYYERVRGSIDLRGPSVFFDTDIE